MSKGSFALDLSKFTHLTENKLEKVVKKTFIDLSTAIIKDTPVLSGRLRNSWFVAVEGFASGVSDRTSKSDEVISNMISDTNEFKLGKMISITNNMPYAERIEYDGWSAKSPSGMVRLNINRFQKWVDKNARSVK
jgi:hypothetical protein